MRRVPFNAAAHEAGFQAPISGSPCHLSQSILFGWLPRDHVTMDSVAPCVEKSQCPGGGGVSWSKAVKCHFSPTRASGFPFLLPGREPGEKASSSCFVFVRADRDPQRGAACPPLPAFGGGDKALQRVCWNPELCFPSVCVCLQAPGHVLSQVTHSGAHESGRSDVMLMAMSSLASLMKFLKC